jgi:hypothetical protein
MTFMTPRFLAVVALSLSLSFNWLWPCALAALLGRELPTAVFAGWAVMNAAGAVLVFYRLFDPRGP